MIKRSSKFFLANDYQRRIFSALNVINNLLIVYNSQFDWVVRVNERLIENIKIPVSSIENTISYTEPSNSENENNNEDTEFILEAIWNEIELSIEFRNYLLHEDNPTKKAGGKKTYRKKLHTKSRNTTHSKNKRHNKTQ